MVAIQLKQPLQGTSDTGLEKAMSTSLTFSHWHIAHYQQMPITPIAVINDFAGGLAVTNGTDAFSHRCPPDTNSSRNSWYGLRRVVSALASCNANASSKSSIRVSNPS
jgi:hypothetical protein